MSADLQDIGAELRRLSSGVGHYRAWKIDLFNRVYGPDVQIDLNTIVEPAAEFLRPFTNSPSKQTANFVLGELKRWYAATASELAHIERHGSDVDREEANTFLDSFHQELGFRFEQESGLFRSTVDTVLKRGVIETRQEYRTVKDVLDDAQETLSNETESQKLNQLLNTYEANT